jgi:hypothetical protein
MKPCLRFGPSLLAAALAVVSLSAAPAPAHANMAATRHDPTATGPLVFAGKTALRVTEEFLSFDCHAVAAADPACDFEARYLVTNPSPAREEVVAAFVTDGAREVTIAVDGKAARRALAPDEVESVSAAVSRGQGASDASSFVVPNDAPGVTLVAEAGSKHELVVHGVLPVGHVWYPHGYSYDAIFARHLALAHEPERVTYEVRYQLWPLQTWADDPVIHLRVRHPSSWHFDREGWTEGSERGATLQTRDVPLSQAENALELSFTREPFPIQLGGLLLGLGGAKGDFSGFRARLGYEVAIPRELLWSVSFDLDFKGKAFVSPTATLATGALWFIPSFGIGVGLPVQLAPERRVGARLQLDVMFYALGFVTSLDVFPQSHGDPYTQATFLAQIAL